jgi:chromosome segregation ATPase
MRDGDTREQACI